MVFIAPVELVPVLAVQIGGGVDAERTIRSAFRLVFLGELVFRKGFRIVLLCVCHDRSRIQSDEG